MAMLTVRSDDVLDAKLDEIVTSLRAEGQNVSKSSVVRAILHEHLGTSDKAQLVRESMRLMHRVFRGVSTRAVEALTPQMPGFVDAALNEDEGSA